MIHVGLFSQHAGSALLSHTVSHTVAFLTARRDAARRAAPRRWSAWETAGGNAVAIVQTKRPDARTMRIGSFRL
jgi:hypothetical protein